MTRSQILSALALACFLALGCGGKGSTVTGTVTFNGQPLEKGYITFTPTEGKGAPVGGEIVKGKYTAANVTPGKNKVLVVSTVVTEQAAESMDASIAAAKKAPAGASKDQPTENSEGNNQAHDIPSGNHTLDLTIKTGMSADGKVR